MKKAILFLAIILAGIYTYAQGAVEAISLPFENYFISISAIVVLVVPITEWLKKLLKATGFGAQVISWLVSIALCFVGWAFKLGMFETINTWWVVLLYGLGTGLAANGVFDIELIQTILEKIFKPTKP